MYICVYVFIFVYMYAYVCICMNMIVHTSYASLSFSVAGLFTR